MRNENGFPRVAVVGVGQSIHRPERPDVTHAELLLEAVDEALEDAGITLGDIDNAVTSCQDFWDGRTIANMAISEVVGSYLKPESRLSSDGAAALVYGWGRMRCGEYRLGLVTAHSKESEGRAHEIEKAAFDPFTQRRLDPDGDVVAGLAARLFFEESGTGPREAAERVVEARRAGRRTPKVSDLPEVTVEDVLGSPMLASPIHELDKAPGADGSCALVLASEEVAEELGVVPVWVTGVGSSTDAYWSDRDLARADALERARAQADRLSGWTGSAELVEFSAQFSFQVLQYAPIFSGPNGDQPVVNPSGGWLAGSPITVTGLARAAEVVQQLRGRGGDQQISGARRGYAHGVAGLGGQTHVVIALEGEG